MEASFLMAIMTIALSLVVFKMLGLISKVLKKKPSLYQGIPVEYLEKYPLN